LNLDGDAGGVSSASGRLDGEWSDGTSAFPSGNGGAGGDFRFRINVLPGDADRNGTVLANDFSEVKRKFFSSTTNLGSGAAAYSIFHDVTGSGNILADDFSEVKRRFFNTLP
jgi:Dockerin type I domain